MEIRISKKFVRDLFSSFAEIVKVFVPDVDVEGIASSVDEAFEELPEEGNDQKAVKIKVTKKDLVVKYDDRVYTDLTKACVKAAEMLKPAIDEAVKVMPKIEKIFGKYAEKWLEPPDDLEDDDEE